MTPQLTIGIPVYNGMPFLRETMESVLSQEFSDFVILVINDGSKDDSHEYLSSIRDPRLRVISQENRGLTAALNRMLEETRTPWLVRLDADDIALPSRTGLIAKAIQQNPNAGMFYSRAKHHQHANVVSMVRSTEGSPAELRGLTESGYLLSICHSSVVLNVNKTRELGGYRFNLHIEDLDLWWRMALAYDIVFIPEVSVAYRLNQASVCINNLRELTCNALYAQYLLLSRLWDLGAFPYEKVRPALQTLVNERHLHYREQMWRAAICMSNREYHRAATHMAVAAVNAPGRFIQRCSYPLWPAPTVRVGESPAVFKKLYEHPWAPVTSLAATCAAL
jgi:glycosyltransferase involved in cell wall biosynthesis